MGNGCRLMANLPEGFKLDPEPSGVDLPEGFVLDREKPAEQPSFTDKAIGIGEGVLSAATGALAAPIAGIVGLADAANPFNEEGAGGARVRQVQEALTFEPRTKQGKAELEGDILRPIGEKIQEFREGLGEGALQATGSPFLAAIATALPDATLALFPIKGIKGKPSIQQAALEKGVKQIKQPFSELMTKSDKAIAKLILEKSDDISTSKVKLSAENLKSSLSDGLARIVKDKNAIEVIKQGFSEKSTAIIKSANKTTREGFKKMVDIADKGLRSGTEEALNRMGDVVGQTLKNRVEAAIKVNRRTGALIDKVAKTNLKGSVDANPIKLSFLDDLNSMKIKVDGNKLTFAGSDIEGGVTGAATAQKILQLTSRRLRTATGGNNAFKLHELKRFIDKQVKFGKDPSGAAGGAEEALKSLRRKINNVLGENFPKYKEINTKFSETKTALDNFQEAAGTSIDFTSKFSDKGLGVKMRSLTSNNLTRSRLLNSMSELEDVLVKNGVNFKDRILQQVIIANDLESLLKLAPKTGFKGQIAEAGIDVVAGSNIQAGIKTGRSLADKISGKSPEKAIQAIRKLLKENK